MIRYTEGNKDDVKEAVASLDKFTKKLVYELQRN